MFGTKELNILNDLKAACFFNPSKFLHSYTSGFTSSHKPSECRKVPKSN